MCRQASRCSGKLRKHWEPNRETCSGALAGQPNRRRWSACFVLQPAQPLATYRVKQKEAPPDFSRAGLGRASVTRRFPRPRPQQGVAFAAFVVEQVCIDRRIEGGVVELEREIVATFLGALRPGCADLGLMWCTT